MFMDKINPNTISRTHNVFNIEINASIHEINIEIFNVNITPHLFRLILFTYWNIVFTLSIF